jgi:hypothetical protein
MCLCAHVLMFLLFGTTDLEIWSNGMLSINQDRFLDHWVTTMSSSLCEKKDNEQNF